MTQSELLVEIDKLILSGGGRTTAYNVRKLINEFVSSTVNVEDGGTVIEKELGYSTEIAINNILSFVHKKWVLDQIAGLSPDLSQAIKIDGSTSPAAEIYWNMQGLRAVAYMRDSFNKPNIEPETRFLANNLGNKLLEWFGNNLKIYNAADGINHFSAEISTEALTKHIRLLLPNVPDDQAYTFAVKEDFTLENIIAALAYTPEDAAKKGVANGYTPLGGDGKVSTSYLPDAILRGDRFKGIYNGTVITSDDPEFNGLPLPTAAPANTGVYFIATADFTVASIDYKTGDWIISLGSAGWSKVDNTDAVISFNSRIGNIVLTSSDVLTALGYTPVSSSVSYANPSFITSLAYSKLTGTPTTVATSGLTDVYTKTQVDAAIDNRTFKTVTANISGNVVLDMSLGRCFFLTLTGPVTSFSTTNKVPGTVYYIYFIKTVNHPFSWLINEFEFPFKDPIVLTDPTQNGSSPAYSKDKISAYCSVIGKLEIDGFVPDLQLYI